MNADFGLSDLLGLPWTIASGEPSESPSYAQEDIAEILDCSGAVVARLPATEFLPANEIANRLNRLATQESSKGTTGEADLVIVDAVRRYLTSQSRLAGDQLLALLNDSLRRP